MGCHFTKQFEGVLAHIQGYSCSTVSGTCHPWPQTITDRSLRVEWSNSGIRWLPCGFLGCTQRPPKCRGRYVVLLEYLKNHRQNIRQGTASQLLVLCNRTAVHNQLLQHGFQTTWRGGLRVSTSSSAAGATALIAVIVQTGCGFLRGGRRGATLDDREDCFGRATVALTRAILHTYIVSPVEMAGLIGMAQTLAVFHFGYHTLKRREVQFHGTTRIPTDAAAILDWGLDTPFTSQDRPPFAIAVIATVDGTRCLRRYRFIVAQKSKLRLSPEVATAFASRTADHRLTASGFFPCSIDREFLYGCAADGYRSPL